ncbi:four helix bundle protein [Natroniella sp. ANB-PHB2]|uniref:four helix bundle protein n=1 Tax=Natroniella sp. ANB-PHB2 TaxID=3384444 RepID=UPI0038D3EAAD
MSNAENLVVFKKAHKLTIDMYKMTKSFPSEEKFGLVSQIKRASSSINANLMEGSHRKTDKEYRQFAVIARGSIGELKYHLLLAKDLGYISKKKYFDFRDRINEISKMLTGLMKAL